MNFKTPQEAIDACNKECERAWMEYIIKTRPNKPLDENDTGYKVAKAFFQEGFRSGAGYISGLIVKKVQEK